METKVDVKLTKANVSGLIMFAVVLLVGVLGGVANQAWAENIYTFLSVVATVIFVGTAFMKSRLKPLKQYIAMYFVHVLFCVAMGWWWLVLLWVITTVAAGIGMSNYMDAAKKATTKKPPCN
jgi:hypothetical protein